jgi:elongation factor G
MQGIQAALSGGVLGGFEVTDVHVCIEGGSYHDSDSNDLVFKDAAEKATAKALRLAQPIILEALVATTISIPEEFTGSVLETVHACGEAIQTMQVEGAATSLAANFAASQAHKLVAKVLTSTQGRANLSMVILGFIESKPEPPEDWAVVT